jgi:hypothetical protein
MDVSYLCGQNVQEERYCDLCDAGFSEGQEHLLTEVVFSEDVIRTARQIPLDPLKKCFLKGANFAPNAISIIKRHCLKGIEKKFP